MPMLALSNAPEAIPSMLAAATVLESCNLIPVTLLVAPMPKWVLIVLMSRANDPLQRPLLDPPGPTALTEGGVMLMLELSGIDELKGLPSTPSTMSV